MKSPQSDPLVAIHHSSKLRISPTKLAVAVAVGIVSICSHQAYAFKPSNAISTGSVVDCDPLTPCKGRNHMGLTIEALANPFIVNGKSYIFRDWVVAVIKKANACVDENGDDNGAPTGDCLVPGAFDTTNAHCDAEDLEGCSGRVKNLKESAITFLENKEYPKARLEIGRALHTVQDVYAHSNWADLIDMGSNIEPIYLEDGLTSAQGYKDDGMRLEDSIDNKTCDNWTHVALNIWDYNPFISLGSRGRSQLTSGWYEAPIFKVSTRPPITFKCDHGLTAYTGLAKDAPGHDHFETARNGAVLATQHFINSLLQDPRLSDEIVRKFMGIAGGDVNIGFLVDTTGSMGGTIVGVKSAISKVVDDIKAGKKTVSKFTVMSYGDPGIGEVNIADNADAMSAYTNAIQLGVPDGGGDCPERTTKALQETLKVTPNNTSLFVYTDASTHEAELATEIINTAKAKNIGVNFFVSGNCGGEGNSAVYEQIAKATGGVVSAYEHSATGAESTFAQINPVFKGNLQSGFTIKGVLAASAGSRVAARAASSAIVTPTLVNMGTYVASDGNASNVILPETADQKAARLAAVTGATGVAARSSGVAAEAASTTVKVDQAIKVDSSATSMVVVIDMSPLGVVKLFRPDGVEVLKTDSGVSISESSVNKTFSIDAPVVGEWKVSVEGLEGTEYEISTKMNSDVSLISFAFTEVKGRSGHEGMFEISGQPLATEDQAFVLDMGGSVETAELVIVSLDGKDLGTATLTNEGGALGATKFSGVIKLPTQDFRVYVRGKDKNGKDYQRLYPQVYHGQFVRVDAQTGEYDVTAGRKVKASFKVQNKGLGDNFTFTATNSLNYPMTLSSTEETLDTDGSVIVAVDIDVPAEAAANTTFDVTLTAQSKTNADSVNTATNKFIVAADTDGDGISDYTEKGGSVNDATFDGNGDGTPDWKQANVASFTAIDASPITLEVSKGTLSKTRSTADPSNGEEKIDKANFPMGYLDFSIAGLATGDESVLKIHYPANMTPSKYYKFEPTTTLATPAWYIYNNAKIESGLTTVILKDGQDGDSDLTANGTIVDPGGLGFIPNTRPVANADTATTKQDTPVTTSNVLANDTDADGDTLTISTADTASTQGGTVVNNGNGTFTYTPKTGFVGDDTFTYAVSDGKAGTATANVTVTVESNGRGNGSGSSNSGGGGSADFLGLFALLSLFTARWFRSKKTA